MNVFVHYIRQVFNIVAVTSENHSTNVSAFNILIDISISNRISILTSIHMQEKIKFNHPANINGIYLFDQVHLLKSIGNSILISKRFTFPQFKFDEFYDSINLDSGEITWKLLHNVYDKDENS